MKIYINMMIKFFKILGNLLLLLAILIIYIGIVIMIFGIVLKNLNKLNKIKSIIKNKLREI